MFQEIEVGKVYTGRVVSITQFGPFMEVLPSKERLVHASDSPWYCPMPKHPQRLRR